VCGDRSGRKSAPIVPQRVQTISEHRDRTGVSSNSQSALRPEGYTNHKASDLGWPHGGISRERAKAKVVAIGKDEQMNQPETDDFTGMWELLDAIEAVIKAADPTKREALAHTIDAYAEDFPDEFFWASGAQAPTLLFHLLNTIDSACRPEAQSKPRPAIRLVDRKPEGNA